MLCNLLVRFSQSPDYLFNQLLFISRETAHLIYLIQKRGKKQPHASKTPDPQMISFEIDWKQSIKKMLYDDSEHLIKYKICTYMPTRFLLDIIIITVSITFHDRNRFYDLNIWKAWCLSR